MLQYKIVRDSDGIKWLETRQSGKALLTIPQLNKGTAFTMAERSSLGLLGKLPCRVETLAEQVARAQKQYDSFTSPLSRHIYLYNLHDTNQTVFYALVSQNLGTMLPMIYTPIVGHAIKQFSQEFRQSRGLYLTYNDQDRLVEILNNRSNPNIDLVVVTDGEGILGIGDQGVGGMDIPIAKLMVYTLCGGIDANRTLPILLDVGTNNPALLNDPFYLGWRHKRIDDAEYDQFIQKFISAFSTCFPDAFLHWEDLSPRNARRNLSYHQKEICAFNDDMQGTGAVSLAAIIAASKRNQFSLTKHRIVIFGAGTAGTGIADQLHDALVRAGLTAETAYRQFWLIDIPGLLTDDLGSLQESQRPYAHPLETVADWHRDADGKIGLAEVVKRVKPTVLIGCSSQTNAFSEEIIRQLAKDVAHPIILPLSNPNEKAESAPEDIIHWTNNQAYVATGSPYPPVEYQGKMIEIPQNNNALIFPGIGLGVTLTKPSRMTSSMLWVACEALASASPILKDPEATLLPMLADAPSVAKKIGKAVAQEAIDSGLAKIRPVDLDAAIEENYWVPGYLPYRKPTNHPEVECLYDQEDSA